MGLIVVMARRHHPATMARGAITSDVIQEGSLAVLRAAETFNPGLGYRFSTYAGWWVRDRVTRCVTQQARIIRLPQYGERETGRLGGLREENDLASCLELLFSFEVTYN